LRIIDGSKKAGQVGPKEKHYLCVGFEIEIHEFSDDINIGCEPGREKIFFG